MKNVFDDKMERDKNKYFLRLCSKWKHTVRLQYQYYLIKNL